MQSLTYFADPLEVFRRLESMGQPAMLDSGGNDEHGRWDIIAAAPDPSRTLWLDGDSTAGAVDQCLQRWQWNAQELCSGDSRASELLPFNGGYLGQISYELGRRLQGLPQRSSKLPLACAHFYPWAIVQDRREQRSWLCGDYPRSLALRIERLLGAPVPQGKPFTLLSPFSSSWDLVAYKERFDRVQAYIQAGDAYQINLGQPFKAPYEGSLIQAYDRLRPIASAPYSALIPMGDSFLLSLSPEQFLTIKDRDVETRPIKGTRPRHECSTEDRAAAESLLASEKERAENLMIVDLLRNDLGRFCVPGTVEVDALFNVESYATVHHLVSVVRGRLRGDVSPPEALLGCLPGGSITGAPKHRAMEIIDELEAASRESWCGSVFSLSRSGELHSNIAIRSFYGIDGTLFGWAGGGLVADSSVEDEYQEQQDKIGALMRALEVPSNDAAALRSSTRANRGR